MAGLGGLDVKAVDAETGKAITDRIDARMRCIGRALARSKPGESVCKLNMTRPGTYNLLVGAAGYQSTIIPAVEIQANKRRTITARLKQGGTLAVRLKTVSSQSMSSPRLLIALRNMPEGKTAFRHVLDNTIPNVANIYLKGAQGELKGSTMPGIAPGDYEATLYYQDARMAANEPIGQFNISFHINVGKTTEIHLDEADMQPYDDPMAPVRAAPEPVKTGGTLPAASEHQVSGPTGSVADEAARPVAGARVVLYHRKSRWGLGNRIVAETRSGADGRFRFEKPIGFELAVPHKYAQDSYILLALHPKHAFAWANIEQGKPQHLHKLVLTRAHEDTVTVTDADGKPVQGAEVWLSWAGRADDANPAFRSFLNLPENIGLIVAETDERGLARIANLPRTDCRFMATAAGYARTWPVTERITLYKAASVSGKVVTKKGQPVKGALIRMEPLFRYHFYLLARTDAEGRFKIAGIPAKGWLGNDEVTGRYRLTVESAAVAAPGRVIQLDPGEATRDITWRAAKGRLVRVTVLEPETDRPIHGVRIMGWSGVHGRRRLNGFTDRNGIVEWRVDADSVSVTFLSPPEGTYVVEDPAQGRRSHEINLTDGITEATLHAPSKLGRLVTLHGRVQFPDGRPAAGIAIATANSGPCQLSGGGIAHALTNRDGSFELKDVPDGLDLFLYAHTADHRYVLAEEISPKDGAFDLPNPLVMRPGRRADVLITDEKGNPRANLALKIKPRKWGRNVFRAEDREARTDANGRLRIDGIVPGLEYFLRDASANLSRAADWTKKFHQYVRLIPADEGGAERARDDGPARVVLSNRMLVRVLDLDGRLVPVKRVDAVILHRATLGRWHLDGHRLIETLDDGAAVIERPGPLASYPRNKVEIHVRNDSGPRIEAFGRVPADGSNSIVLRTNERMPVADQAAPPLGPTDAAVRVLDPDGNPVQGAKVSFPSFFKRRHDKWQDVVTDADGVFVLAGYAAKSWYRGIQVDAPGFAPKWITRVIPGKRFTVTLDNTSRLRGALTAPDGQRAGPARITLVMQQKSFRGRLGFNVKYSRLFLEQETDANGAFDWPLETGEYAVRIESRSDLFAKHASIWVEKGSVTTLPPELQPGIRLEMRLIDRETNKPVKGAKVYIEETVGYAARFKEGAERTTNADGFAVWERLGPGVTVFALPMTSERFARWWSEQSRLALRRGRKMPRKPTLRDGINPLSFDVKRGMKPVLVRVEKCVTVTGTVRDPGRKPLPEVRVNVVWTGHLHSFSSDARYMRRTDEKGRYTLRLPAGHGERYNIICSDPKRRWANAVSKPFNSKPGDWLRFDFRMSSGGSIVGRVVDTAGKPVSGIAVEAAPKDGRGNSYYHPRAVTDQDGRFTIVSVRPGKSLVYPDSVKGVNTDRRRPDRKREVRVRAGETTQLGDLVDK